MIGFLKNVNFSFRFQWQKDNLNKFSLCVQRGTLSQF